MEKGTYTVIAAGKTYPVAADLKSWAFRWDHQRKVWFKRTASAGECDMFKRMADGGAWDGVELEIIKEPE